MELSQQVITIEQAKRLKELGVVQKSSLFSWFGDESVINEDAKTMTHPKWVFIKQTESVNLQDDDNRNDLGINEPIAAAFTVAELGVMLPRNFASFYCGYDIWRIANTFDYAGGNDTDNIGDYYKGNSKTYINFNSTAEAVVRGNMLIYLLENNRITSEGVNSSLT
jgi:hypothetical protein